LAFFFFIFTASLHAVNNHYGEKENDECNAGLFHVYMFKMVMNLMLHQNSTTRHARELPFGVIFKHYY
jgi:hypothetical protein